MAKLSREHAERHAFELSRCLKMYEALSVSKCSLTRVLIMCGLHTRVQAVLPAMSVRPPNIFAHVQGKT